MIEIFTNSIVLYSKQITNTSNKIIVKLRIFLQPNFVDLKYFKIRILLGQII